MIDVHYVATSNGMKVAIMLEELGLPYRLIVYELFEGQHLTPQFRAINPNCKLPAIVDHAPVDGGKPFSVFESGAILLYLAEKTGKLLPKEPRARSLAQQWLTWQAAGLGPMMGQAHHFVRYAPTGQDYAMARYRNEVSRLLDVLEYRLSEAPYLAGDEYSIADIMVWVWANPAGGSLIGMDMGNRPATAAWFARVADRPAICAATGEDRGIPAHYLQHRAMLTPAQWSNMFGENLLAAARGDQRPG